MSLFELKYYLLHKPRSVVCSTVDSTINNPKHTERVHTTIYEYIASKGIILNDNLHPVGRLDADTTGIILITDDKQLLKLIRNPQSLTNNTDSSDEVIKDNPYKQKEYILTLLGKKCHKIWSWTSKEENETIERFSEPFTFRRNNEILTCARANVTLLDRYQDKEYMRNTELPFLGWCLKVKVIISEGKNHQVRRIASRNGYQVISLVRTRISQILHISSVPNEGDMRELTPDEVKELYEVLK